MRCHFASSGLSTAIRRGRCRICLISSLCREHWGRVRMGAGITVATSHSIVPGGAARSIVHTVFLRGCRCRLVGSFVHHGLSADDGVASFVLNQTVHCLHPLPSLISPCSLLFRGRSPPRAAWLGLEHRVRANDVVFTDRSGVGQGPARETQLQSRDRQCCGLLPGRGRASTALRLSWSCMLCVRHAIALRISLSASANSRRN